MSAARCFQMLCLTAAVLQRKSRSPVLGLAGYSGFPTAQYPVSDWYNPDTVPFHHAHRLNVVVFIFWQFLSCSGTYQMKTNALRIWNIFLICMVLPDIRSYFFS